MSLGYKLSEQWYNLTNSVNYTAASYPVRVPTTTKPSGDGVIPMGEGGGYCPQSLDLVPIGVGTSAAYGLQILGWRSTKLGVLTLWVPVTLATYSVTCGTATGVANSDLGSTTLFATTITMTGGPTFVTSGAPPVSLDWFQISPGSNAIGMIKQAGLGYRMLEVLFNISAGTSGNCLYCKS